MVKTFLEKKAFRYLSLSVFIIVISILLWSVNKGILFSDEAFYLLHLEDYYTIDFSNWHHFAKYIFVYGLLTNRLLVIFLLLLSSFFMGFSVARTFLLSNAFFVGLLTAVFQFITYSPVGFSPSYLTFNPIIYNFSFGLFFLYYKNPKYWIVYLIGFITAIIPFNIITNSLVVLLILILIMHYSNVLDRKKVLLAFSLGLITFLALFFLKIQSVEKTIFKFKESFKYISFDPKHNSLGLIKWHIKLGISFLPGFLFFLYLLIPKFKDYINSKKKLLCLSVFIIGIWVLYTFYKSFVNGNFNYPTTLFYFFLTPLIVKLFKTKFEVFKFCILLLLIPYFASIGTDVNYFFRSSYYFPFIFISILVIFKYSEVTLNSKIIIFLLASIFVNFLFYPFAGCWEKYKLVEQTQEFKLGEDKSLLLDEKRIHKLQSLYPLVSGNKAIVVSNQRLWGLVYLLKLKPAIVYYRTSPFVLDFIINSKINRSNLVFIESHENRFTSDFKNFITAGKFYRNETVDYTVYSLK